MAERVVCIYSGLGASPACLTMLYNRMEKNLHGSPYGLRMITPQQIMTGALTVDQVALLAVGGGFDTGFVRALGPAGTKVIREYVEQGGNYLGICAGGYFGCAHVQFDKGGPLEVCGDRDLKFFPGTCVGPAYPGFKYNSEQCAHASPLSWDVSNLTGHGMVQLSAYFNGGGYFCEAEPPTADLVGGRSSSTTDPDGIQVIATYTGLPGNPTAAVKCHVAKGVAVLMGSHVEYMAQDMNHKDPYLKDIIPSLVACRSVTDLVFRSILKHVGLCLEPPEEVMVDCKI